MQNKHYWLLTTEYPPFHGGGISTYMAHTAKMMNNNGHIVRVFVADNTIELDLIEERISEDLIIIRFNIDKINYAPKYLGYVARLSYCFCEIVLNYIHELNIAPIIESQDYNAISYYLLQRKRCLDDRLKNITIGLSLHCPWFVAAQINQIPRYTLPEYWTGEMERFAISAADFLTSPSEAMVTRLVREGLISVERAAIVPNPFRLSNSIDPVSQEETNKSKGIYFFGRTQYAKGILDLIHALIPMWDSGYTEQLNIIGGDNEYFPKGISMVAYLQSRFGEYIKSGKIKILGKLSSNDALSKIRLAKVIVIPSHFEAFPYVVLESMSLGKVVVTSQSGGQYEVIGKSNKYGYTFPKENINSLGKLLRRATSLTASESYKIGCQAIRRVYEYTNYEVIYEKKIAAISVNNLSKYSFPFIRPRTLTHIASYSDKSISEVKDLLSVVIPYYNMGEYVEETLKSIKNSSYAKIEIIIIDDGSTNKKCIDVVNKLSKIHSCRLIRVENQGLSNARNIGAVEAKGEFLAFLDADDMIISSFYEKAIKVLKHYDNVGFVGTSAQYFGASSSIWPCWNPEPPYLLVHNTICSSALVYKRQHFINFGKNDREMAYGMEDYESVIRLVSNGVGGVALPDPLFNYRIRSDSMSRQFNKNSILYLYELIAKKNASFFSEYASEIANILNSNGPGYAFDNPTFEVS